MLSGWDGLGQSWELLWSQNLWEIAIGRGGHHPMASELIWGLLSLFLFPATVPWASLLWTTLPPWSCFLVGAPFLDYCLWVLVGCLETLNLDGTSLRPFPGLNDSFGCWQWAVPFIALNYVAPGVGLMLSPVPELFCRLGCSRSGPGTGSPTGLRGSVWDVSENPQGVSLNISDSNTASRNWENEAEGC